MKQRKYNVILIVGPTCIGKTDITLKLKKIFKTKILGMDALQVYKHFKIVTGRSDAKGQIKLQNFRDPLNELKPREYVELLKREIKKSKKIPIVDGLSRAYFKEIIKSKEIKPLMIGIRFKNKPAMHVFEKRLEKMLKEGLIKEVKQAIKKGYEDSPVVHKSSMQITLEYVRGKISKEEHNKKVVKWWYTFFIKQMKFLKKYKQIIWVYKDKKALEEIIKIIKKETDLR